MQKPLEFNYFETRKLNDFENSGTKWYQNYNILTTPLELI